MGRSRRSVKYMYVKNVKIPRGELRRLDKKFALFVCLASILLLGFNLLLIWGLPMHGGAHPHTTQKRTSTSGPTTAD
jgi:hypothetical protein